MKKYSSTLINAGDELESQLKMLNRWRLVCESEHDKLNSEAYERLVESLFAPSCKLAVYGTLAPGKVHHDVMKPYEGEWTRGIVRGKLVELGWATHLGCPGMCWDPGAEPIQVHMLTSKDLVDNWHDMDAFEGAEYVRILAPIENAFGVFAVANIYALRTLMMAEEGLS